MGKIGFHALFIRLNKDFFRLLIHNAGIFEIVNFLKIARNNLPPAAAPKHNAVDNRTELLHDIKPERLAVIRLYMEETGIGIQPDDLLFEDPMAVPTRGLRISEILKMMTAESNAREAGRAVAHH